MHYTHVYYWVSAWWANRIGLASLIKLVLVKTLKKIKMHPQPGHLNSLFLLPTFLPRIHVVSGLIVVP